MMLSNTEIQGMMAGDWEQGTILQLSESRSLVCIDGELWELRDEEENLSAIVNPTSAVSGRVLIEELELLSTLEPAMRRRQLQPSVSD
jgi:hypothetical protein